MGMNTGVNLLCAIAGKPIQSPKRPFHGGNTGSNPVGDANKRLGLGTNSKRTGSTKSVGGAAIVRGQAPDKAVAELPRIASKLGRFPYHGRLGGY